MLRGLLKTENTLECHPTKEGKRHEGKKIEATREASRASSFKED